MTQEQKELLLKDLSARLFYGIFVKENRESLDDNLIIYTLDYHPCIDNCKPYLRPMSSMTDEEKNELLQLMGCGTDIERVDFYISHYFDYRGLIPMDLALTATEDMYNIK